MKIKEIIAYGKEELKEEEDGILKARLLLAFLLDVSKEYLITHLEEEVSTSVEKIYKKKIQELKKGKPLQYITKKQEFMGYSFFVDERVLIPQPDTEILVETVLQLLQKRKNPAQILDLCTGSGAIGISIAKKMPNSKVVLADISSDALEVASQNAKQLECPNICLVQSDFWKSITGVFDIIVSNPPYIPTSVIATLSKEVREEPILALDGGEDRTKCLPRHFSKSPYLFKGRRIPCVGNWV